ncbi:MAG: hypothetical protein WBB98_04975 [Xanthobacteraceae bacterium]
MSDDLVSRLRDAHANSTQRIFGSNIFEEAAQAITEARAEIEEVRRTAKHLLIAANIYQDRALAAESELSTLRARVREVVGPFARDFDLNNCSDRDDDDAMEVSIRHLRAARQLMEEVK